MQTRSISKVTSQKETPGLGRAIRIVRAAKGPSGYPPRILLSRHSLGRSSTRHIRIGRCDRLIAAGKDPGWQMTPPRMPPLTVASIQKAGLALPRQLHRQFELFTRGLNARSAPRDSCRSRAPGTHNSRG